MLHSLFDREPPLNGYCFEKELVKYLHSSALWTAYVTRENWMVYPNRCRHEDRC